MTINALVHLRSRLRRRRRRILVILLSVVGGLAGLWGVLMEGTLLRHVVAWQIGSRLDADCTIDSFAWNGWNHAVIKGLSLRVRGWPESASEVVRVDRALADFDPLPLLWFSLAITNVEVDGMLVRIIERNDGTDVNIMALDLPATGGGTVRPPSLSIRNLSVQAGVIDDGTEDVRLDPLAQRDLSGTLVSSRSVPNRWDVELRQRPRGGDPAAMLDGWFMGDEFAYSVTLSDLVLDPSLRRLFPGPIRSVWTSLDLTGRIKRVTMEGDRDQPVRAARLEVKDLDLSLPDPGLADTWARYRDGVMTAHPGVPRIQVTEGAIRFDDWRLTLERLQGRLTVADPEPDTIPMPVELSFTIDLDRGRLRDWDGRDPEGWAQAALEYAPFELNLAVQNFGIMPVDGRPPTLELPRAAAQILENFMVREGNLSISAHVRRGDPFWRAGAPDDQDPDEGPIASEIQFGGSIAIVGGRGGYFKFPYELQDVSADISFADDVVDVHYLRGRGSEGARVSVSGTVLDPGDDAGVDLRIVSDRVPIDDALVQGLRYSPAQRFLTLLFDQRAFASLQQAGTIQRTAELLQARRKALLVEAAAIDPNVGDAGTVEARRSALAAKLRLTDGAEWLPAFKPGGWCMIDLRVQRDIAGGDHVMTTGAITLLEAEAICEVFPYPLRVPGRPLAGADASTILVEDERIILPPAGLQLQLPGGGSGVVMGSIDLPRGADGERIVTPRITVRTQGDALNPLLLAAVPLDTKDGPSGDAEAGWPGVNRSEAAELIDAIGLEGTLAANLNLGGDGAGSIDWQARLELTDGRAIPKETLEEEGADNGLEWPEAFVLDRCSATIEIDESIARLLAFDATASGGVLHGSGEADLNSGARALRVTFDDIAPGPYIIDLFPEEEAERWQRLWETHEPSGAFDAELDWSKDAHGLRRRRLRLEPSRLAFLVAPRPGEAAGARARVEITRTSGDLLVVDSVMQARALLLRISEPGGHDSTLLVDGRTGAGATGEALELGVDWSGARFESPLLMQAFELAGADAAIGLWREVTPSGRFDARLVTVTDPGVDTLPWRVRLRPFDLALSLDGTPTAIQVDPTSESLTIEPTIVHLPHITGTTDHGRFELSGNIPLDAERAAECRVKVRYDGSRLGAAEFALFGTRARRALAAIEFACEGPTRLEEGELLFGVSDEPSIARFRGRVTVANASFRSGVQFTELAGSVTVDIDPAARSQLDIIAQRFRVAGHAVHDATATVMIAADGSRVDVTHLNGILAGGSASAGVVVRFDSEAPGGGDYQVWTRLVGAQLEELPAHAPDDLDGASASGSLAAGATGRVDGEMLIGGPLDLPQQRLGRGRLQIRDGRMAELPITMSLLQVSQLMLPLSTSLNSGDIRFHIDGNRLVFDRFDLTAPTIEFRGRGDMDLRTDELSLRFRNRGTVPLWSDLFGAVSDTLFAIDVRGTFSQPRVSVTPLPPFSAAPEASRREMP